MDGGGGRRGSLGGEWSCLVTSFAAVTAVVMICRGTSLGG